jgi:ribosomal protein S18 acetylase RimI-like enzyme
MEFELTPLLVDEIIFAMENQDSESMLDPSSGMIVSSESEPEEEGGEFLPLPSWSSMDGFRLMEAFVSDLRNPILRERLARGLSSGRGVFRAFKNIVKESPEVEKLWYAFKDRQMKRAVYEWYNGLRESWGLEGIGEEPEETEELVGSDFVFRTAVESDRSEIDLLEKAAFLEARADLPGTLAEALYRRESADTVDGPILVSETATKDFAGFIRGETIGAPGGAKMLSIASFAVKAEYRGLGVGEELLKKLLNTVVSDEYAAISIRVPDTSKAFSAVLEREGFVAKTTVYQKNP